MTTGRTGSDYLHGCLDGVKNIMTFSGKFSYHIFFKNNKQTKKKEILIKNFLRKYKYLFNYNKIENLELNININKFKKEFLKISPERINQKDFLIKLYEAFHLTMKKKISPSNIIVHHSHGRINTKKFLDDFQNATVLVTIRDPRANLKSGLLNWFRYDYRRKHMEHVYIYLRRIRDDLNYIFKISNKKKFIQIEKMGDKNYKRRILKYLGLNYDKKVNLSTFAGIPWKGDKLSNFKNSPGTFNKNIIYNGWREYFSKDEINVLNFLYSKYKKFYKINSVSLFEKIYLFFRVIFPFKFEYLIIKHQKKISLKFISNIFFYIKRVIYLQLLFLNIDIFNYEKKKQ